MPRTKWAPTTRDKKKRQATFDWNPCEYVDYESDYADWDDLSYTKLIDVLEKAAAKAVNNLIADDKKWWD